MTSIYQDDYRRVLLLLIDARKRAKITRQPLATLLKRPQSFVSKFERGERRLDVVEFARISRLLNADPISIPQSIERPS